MILTAISLGQTPLKPRLAPGVAARYVVAESAVSYAGPGTEKATGKIANRTPVEVLVTASEGGSASLTVTDGPVQVGGKSVGRARVRRLTVDAGGSVRGFSPAYFSVPFPLDGAKVGKSWTAGLYGPAPIPGGIRAVYRYVGNQGVFARISAKVDFSGPCHVVGHADLFVRRSDGCLDHGSARFDISYVRPDMKDRSKMNVNSHDVVVCSIGLS